MSDAVGLYLNEIGQVPLLNAEEERELSRAIEAGRLASERLDAGDQDPELEEPSGSRPQPRTVSSGPTSGSS